jgi:hypothetical protein
VYNYDANPDSFDALVILGQFDPDSIWLAKAGNNLVISVAGNVDQITVSDWFANSQNQLDQIRLDQYYLDNQKVDQLVEAMAIYSPNFAAEGTIDEAVAIELTGIMNDSWTLI